MRRVFLFLLTGLVTVVNAQPANLSQIISLFNLTKEARNQLLRDGILLLADKSETNLWKAYDDLTRQGDIPIFVTTDACLYQFYELHKAIVREIEMAGLVPLMKQLLRDWTLVALEQMESEGQKSEFQIAAWTLIVAEKLLDEGFPAPEALQKQVTSIIEEIVAARRVIECFPFGEDFTQYKPRGHYTTTETLKRYFRAYKWLSRRVYDVGEVNELKQAVLLLHLLEKTPNGLERYGKLVDAIMALSGEPVGIILTDVHKALTSIGVTSAQALESSEILWKLRSELMKPEYRGAKIVTHPVPAVLLPPPAVMPKKQIRILPEIVLPDSEVLQWTGDPNVPKRMPSGLDVAAALGCERAKEMIGEKANGLLVLQHIKPFQEMWARWKEEDWQRSVYTLWLWAIRAVLEEDRETPSFMKTSVWRDWKLNTALASWAQLRHAYGLYSAPVYIYMGLKSGIPLAYLEPNPRCYERLVMAAERLREVLLKLGIYSQETEFHLRHFTKLMRQFVEIAKKEVQGEPLSEKEVEMLFHFADLISPLPRETPVTVMDIVTHSQTGEVLHVTSGKLHPVLIVVDTKPYEPFVAVGWSLSYYEFARPNYERLTDQEWEKWLERDIIRPEPPDWARSFLWSELESYEGFADLRHATSLLVSDPHEAIHKLQEIAHKYEDTLVGPKARLILARHFMQRHEFEEAYRQIKAFFSSADMRLIEEADQLLAELAWLWRKVNLWERAQPYLKRLLHLTQPPEKPLPLKEEFQRQDFRAKGLLLSASLLLGHDEEEFERNIKQVLKECPNSHFIPAAKAIWWWYRFVLPEKMSDRLPPNYLRSEVFSEALQIIRDYPSSGARWFVARFLRDYVGATGIRSTQEADQLSELISKLSRAPKEPTDVEVLVEVLKAYEPIWDLTDIDQFFLLKSLNSSLIDFFIFEDNFERAWKIAQKVKDLSEEQKSILDAWRQEGNEVARMLVRTLRLEREGDFEEFTRTCEAFAKKFPRSRWAPSMLFKAIRGYRALNNEAKANEIEERLLKQFPQSKEARELMLIRKQQEERRKQLERNLRAFMKRLLASVGIEPNPYLTHSDFASALNQLVKDHPKKKEQIVKWVMDVVESAKSNQDLDWEVLRLCRGWLLDHFAKHYPNDPLAYEIRWRLSVTEYRTQFGFHRLPLLIPFLIAPEGTPYRQEAWGLFRELLEQKPDEGKTLEQFRKALMYSEQFPPLKPYFSLLAGKIAMSHLDWKTAQKLLTIAMKKGEGWVREQAVEILKETEQMRQWQSKSVKPLWTVDLYQFLLPPPQSIEDCIKALQTLNLWDDLINTADTDGKWIAFAGLVGTVCIEMSTGKIAWRKKLNPNTIYVVNETVVLTPPISTEEVHPSPLVQGFELMAFDAPSGKLLWRCKLNLSEWNIVVGKQRNFVALAEWNPKSRKGRLIMLDPRTGQRIDERTLTQEEFNREQEKSFKAFGVRHLRLNRIMRSSDGSIEAILRPDGIIAAYKFE